MAKKQYPNIVWRGDVAYLRVKIDGKVIRESLGTSNFYEAKERRNKRMTELEGKVLSDAPPSSWHSPGAAPKRYASTRDYADRLILEARARGSSEATLKDGLIHRWDRLCAVFPTVDTITNDSVAAYYFSRLGEGLRWASVKRDIPGLRDCVNKWGRKKHPELELVDWEVPHKPRHEELDKKRGTHKDPAFLRAWAANLKGRAQLQALVAMCTGLRAEELRRVQPKWVERIADERIHYVLRLPASATKNGAARSVGLPASVAAIIRQHFPIAEDFKKQFVATAKRMGHGDTVTLRDLRHTFKTYVSRKEPLAVALVLGHRRAEGGSGDFYQHLLDDDCVRVALVARDLFLASTETAAS